MWCYQHGTNEQYTGCIRVSQDGRTCYSPTIRYGTTYGGRPMNHPDDITSWCQQLFPTISTSGTAIYQTQSELTTVPLFWCSEYDEMNPHWCDSKDGYWKDSKLGPDVGAHVIQCLV